MEQLSYTVAVLAFGCLLSALVSDLSAIILNFLDSTT